MRALLLAVILLIIPCSLQAADEGFTPYKSGVRLLQQQDSYNTKITALQLANYIKDLETASLTKIPVNSSGNVFDLTVSVAENGRAKFWIDAPAGSFVDKNRADIISAFEKVRPPQIKGIIAFSIAFGAGSEPRKFNLPSEWTDIVTQNGGQPMTTDDILQKIWQ